MINLIESFFFLLFALLVSMLPFKALYLFSDIVYMLIYVVFGYRKKVILDNLHKSSIAVKDENLEELVDGIYMNLSDVIVEGLRSFRMKRMQIIRRHKVVNSEIMLKYYDEGKSVIVVTGHYANWEWGSLSSSLFVQHKTVAFYKPLSNPYVDKLMRWSRKRSGTTLASIYETSDTFEKYKNIPTVYLMAADQNPTNPEKSHWINFLGRDTAFLHGPEKHARNNNYAVMYADVQRVKRGFYTVTLSVLSENPAELKEGELTEKYVKKLESIILKQPANWLWSHRRWKLKRGSK